MADVNLLQNRFDGPSSAKTADYSSQVERSRSKLSAINSKHEQRLNDPNEIARCKRIMTDQLARHPRQYVDKEDLRLFNENQDPAECSSEIREMRDMLKARISSENDRIARIRQVFSKSV